MCLCMYVCMYVCVYLYVCMYVCLYVCMYVCMFVCLYVCMSVCMYVCLHVCTYVCIYIRMFVMHDKRHQISNSSQSRWQLNPVKSVCCSTTVPNPAQKYSQLTSREQYHLVKIVFHHNSSFFQNFTGS